MDEISLAFAAAKSAMELAKGMIGLSKDVAIQQRAAELLGTITDLYDKIQNLQSVITKTTSACEEWKQKALKREAWDKAKAGYSTYHPSPGVTVYARKEQSGNSEESEWLCKHCTDIEMVRSTFQMVHESAAGRQFACLKCGFKFLVPERNSGSGHRVKPRPFI